MDLKYGPLFRLFDFFYQHNNPFISNNKKEFKYYGGGKMKNKAKPDDRRDNVDKIQFNINHTITNHRQAEEMIEESDDPKLKKDLKEKNKRREESLKSMREEIRDEAIAKENNYK